MDHNCSLSGPLSYAVFVDINESRNPNSYKLLKRSSSFQFYQKRKSNATNSSIHSINEVDLENDELPDLGTDGLADFDTSLITTRKTMPDFKPLGFQTISNKHHSLRAHTSLQANTNPSNSCSIPIKNFKNCCENTGFNDYYEPTQISASVPNTSYNSPSRDDYLYLQTTTHRTVESTMSMECNMNDFGSSQYSRSSFTPTKNNGIPTPITRNIRQNIQSQDSSGFYSYQTHTNQDPNPISNPISHSNSVKSRSSSRQNHWQTGHCVIRHSSDSAFLDIYKNSHSLESKHLYSVNLNECTDLEYSVPQENLPPQIKAHHTNNRVKRSTSKRLHSFFKKLGGFRKSKENDREISFVNNNISFGASLDNSSAKTSKSSVRISSKSSFSKKSSNFSRSSSSFRRKIRSDQSEPRSTSSVSSIDDNLKNIFFLRDTCNRIYYFNSENDMEMNAWCEQICECLGHKCVVTHSKGCAAMRGRNKSANKKDRANTATVYSNYRDYGAYKGGTGDKTSWYKTSEDEEDDEPVFDIEPEIEIEPENELGPINDYSVFRVQDQKIKSSSINYRSMSHLRNSGLKNNDEMELKHTRNLPEFSKSLNYIRNPREFEQHSQVTSRSPELYNNFSQMSLAQRESNSTNSSRNTSSVRNSNPPTPPVPERSPFNSVVSSKPRSSTKSSKLTRPDKLTVPMPPIIPNRRPISATLSMDTGICKRRQTLEVRRIETAQRTRLANATLEREYLDLDDSGNSDPLIQLEKMKNVLRKTTGSSGAVFSSETRSGSGSRISEKTSNLDCLELKKDFSGDADFLNNVGYSILDEDKSLPLMSGDDKSEKDKSDKERVRKKKISGYMRMSGFGQN